MERYERKCTETKETQPRSGILRDRYWGLADRSCSPSYLRGALSKVICSILHLQDEALYEGRPDR